MNKDKDNEVEDEDDDKTDVVSRTRIGRRTWTPSSLAPGPYLRPPPPPWTRP